MSLCHWLEKPPVDRTAYFNQWVGVGATAYECNAVAKFAVARHTLADDLGLAAQQIRAHLPDSIVRPQASKHLGSH